MPAVQPDVAVGHDQQGREAGQAFGEQSEDVKRCFVRRVHILEHENRRGAWIEPTSERRGYLVGNSPPLNGICQIAARKLRDVDQRPKWTRREQHVASPPTTPARRPGPDRRTVEPARSCRSLPRRRRGRFARCRSRALLRTRPPTLRAAQTAPATPVVPRQDRSAPRSSVSTSVPQPPSVPSLAGSPKLGTAHAAI